MEPIFIALIIAISIFVVTSAVVIICRRHKQKRFQGEVFAVPAATDTNPGYTVTQIPIDYNTTTYQTNMYAAPYPQQGSATQMSMPVNDGQHPASGVNMYPPSSNMASVQQNSST